MKIICGIDEAGRGPIAGPVSAAAVVLTRDFPRDLLNDSKKMSPSAREKTFARMLAMKVPLGVGWSWPEEIDRINIHRASLLAMSRAFEAMGCLPDEVIVDGLYIPDIPAPARAMVKADALVPEVMAASIAAKVVRDRWMIRYSWFEPDYGYERHKGYPTREHREVCLRLGPSPIQRLSFRVR
ncbi:ribonuclease HII [Marispirochaeta aestuarii]|uniref:ribonuclease HII n=1 Tax=Marispirochaeta aestuarii TaxID=1963862 RepID=UPI0029C972DE|nr:ribonuclease HII [Marispirochaeta aestuarii]